MLGRAHRPNLRSHITSGQIKDDTVDGADIKDETIESVDIMDDTVARVDIVAGLLPPVGSLLLWADPSFAAPTGYLLCDGSSVLRADHADLFDVIGTHYGSVDSAHFTLPDFENRVPVGALDSGGSALGTTGGADEVTLYLDQIPDHTHTVSRQVRGSTSDTAGDGEYTVTGGTELVASSGITGLGASAPVDIRQPFIRVSYIIKST